MRALLLVLIVAATASAGPKKLPRVIPAVWTPQRAPLVPVLARSPAKARALHDQGLAAYESGHADLAVRKLTAAYDAAPSAELLYHLAQAYRMKGDVAEALHLYQRYLDAAPHGPGADYCRAQLDLFFGPT